ncbi:MAG TPA: recombinase family protein [Ktedonobacteraceae bacterium]|nr:recombinase family protein [Ktedonobacteraceae bacterium]
MRVGYMRVSKPEQDEALQRDALQAAGCEKFFLDKITGVKFERKELEAALAFLRPGDTLVVWKLDRVGRSLRHLIDFLRELEARGVDFISTTEKIDTSTPGGKLIFHILRALAEFERDLIRERTQAGLGAARARGRTGGRPRALKSEQRIALARRLFAEPDRDIALICETLKISRATLYRYVGQPADEGRA